MDVGCAQLDRVSDDRVDEFDHRLVDASHGGFVLCGFLDLLDADRLIELFDQPVDHRVGAKRLGDEPVELARRAEKRRHLAAGRPAHFLNRLLIQWIRHRQVDHAAVDFHWENVELPTNLFRKDLHRVLVDAARIQINVVDPEGILDDFGDLLERKNVAVDEGLRDVGLLLKPPTLDQFLRDAGHGPNKRDQPLVLEAEFSLVGLWFSRYRHGFRWGASVLLLYRRQAVLLTVSTPRR